MATLATTNPTLVDLAKRLDPDGAIAQIAEILNQDNEMLDDMGWQEGNLPTGHRSTIRTGLPTPTWRKLYGGVQPTKSATAQVDDATGMLEAYAEVDKALADLNGNTMAFRASEDAAFIEGMSETVQQAVIYGNEGTQPEAFTGFAPRYNALSGAGNSSNILSGSGSGSDNTSIWLVVWRPDTVFGIYPKGSKAGLSTTDKGQVTIENADGSGGRMEAYRTHYKWDCGIVVKDWRYVVRIPNIDISDLKKDASSSSADLINLLARSMELPPNLNGRVAFYANRTVRSFLRQQALNKANMHLTLENLTSPAGVQRNSPVFMGVPIRRVDQITNAETAVS